MTTKTLTDERIEEILHRQALGKVFDDAVGKGAMAACTTSGRMLCMVCARGGRTRDNYGFFYMMTKGIKCVSCQEVI